MEKNHLTGWRNDDRDLCLVLRWIGHCPHKPANTQELAGNAVRRCRRDKAEFAVAGLLDLDHLQLIDDLSIHLTFANGGPEQLNFNRLWSVLEIPMGGSLDDLPRLKRGSVIPEDQFQRGHRASCEVR